MKNKPTKSHTSGFTLLEMLLVIAIIAILAAIVIVAINPARQLAQARNAARASDINSISKAVNQYYIDNLEWPFDPMPTTLTEICDTGETAGDGDNTVDEAGCDDYLDLSELVPDYLAAIPKTDIGATASGTSYYLALEDTTKVVLSAASSTEQGLPLVALGTTTEVGGGGGITCDSGEVDIGGVCYDNVSIWLDADDSDTISTVGALVTGWDDKGPNGNDATSSGSDRPTLVSAALNGLDVLRLSLDKKMSNDIDGFPEGDDSRTVFIVFTAPTPEGRRMLYNWGWVDVGDNNRVYGLLPWSSGSSHIYIHGGNHDIDAGAYSAGTSYVLSNVYDTGTGAIKLWLNGDVKLNSTTSNFDTDNTGDGGSGRVGGANWWDEDRTIDLAEIIVFDEALDQTDIDAIEEYLGDKWGLSIS